MQKPDKGGKFEFVPNSKESNHEVSEKELSIVDNQYEDIIGLAQDPGTLAIFNGSNSLHRVSPVAGNSERIVAVLSYSEVPDFIFSSNKLFQYPSVHHPSKIESTPFINSFSS